MIKWTGTLKGDDGSTAQVTMVTTSATTQPVPTFPDGANTVWIEDRSYPLAAIDPPTLDPAKPGGRDTDQVIAITKASTPARNPFGYELAVQRGLVVTGGVNLALMDADYLLSGHGRGMTFLKGSVGSPVKITKEIAPPVVVVPPATTGHPIMGAYLLLGTGLVSQLNGRCNRALVSFYQDRGLVTWKNTVTAAQSLNGLTAWRAKGGRDVLISIGGQGGSVDLDYIDEGMELINRTQVPMDGIDLDNEAFELSTAQTVSIVDATAQRLGRAPKDFIVSFAPPGGREDKAIATAKVVQQLGYRVYLGQQLYETSISDGDVMRQTAKAVDALGAPSVLVGIMIGDSHNSWTAANAVTRMQAVKARWSDIGGAYVWESSRPKTDVVIAGVGATLGIEAMS